MHEYDTRIGHVISDQVLEVTEEHGLYHSPHEGFAVIREEFIETDEALGLAEGELRLLDGAVRADKPRKEQIKIARWARHHMSHVLMEAIDTIVTLDRYIISCARNEDEFYRLDSDDSAHPSSSFNDEARNALSTYLEEENETAHKMLKRAIGEMEE